MTGRFSPADRGDTAILRRSAETFLYRSFALTFEFTRAVLVARALGPDRWGSYSVAIAFSSVLAWLTCFGFNNAAMFHASKDPTSLSTLAGNAIASAVVIGGGISALLATLFLLEPAARPISDGPLLALALLLIPFNHGQIHAQSLLLSAHAPRTYNVLEVIGPAAALAIVGGVILFGTASPFVFFLAVFAGIAIRLFAAVPVISRRMAGPPRASVQLVRRIAPYAIKSFVWAFLVYVIMKTDVIVLTYMLGDRAAGFYAIATNMADVLYLFPVSVGLVLFPALASERSIEARWRTVRLVAGWIGVAMVAISILIVAVASPLTDLVFGPAFQPSVPIIRLLAPAVTLLAVGSIIGRFVAADDVPASAVYFSVFVIVLNIGLDIVLIRGFGIAGAAYATIASYALILSFNLRLASNVRRRPIPSSGESAE